MNTLDPAESTTTTTTKIEYVVQFGYIGGTIAEPVAYWNEHPRSFETLLTARAAIPRVAPVGGRFHTGQARIVKRTTVVTVEPVEFDA